VATPHDDAFRFTFGHCRLALPWFRSVLPRRLVRAIAWSTLRRAPEVLQGETLRLRFADLVFHAERRAAKGPLWLLAEHKSSHDREVVDQLLRYVVHLRARSPRPGFAGPVPVVPVLLHHGERPFSIPRRTGDPFEGCTPRLRFFVDDLVTTSEAAIRARRLPPFATLSLLAKKSLAGLDERDAIAAFDRWADLLRAADHDDGEPTGADAIRALGYYALQVADVTARDLHETFERILQRPEDTIMSTAEKLRREGMEKGRVEGRVEALVRQLAKRFGAVPDAISARLRNGTPAELDLWTDRVLDARSLAEVFDGER